MIVDSAHYHTDYPRTVLLQDPITGPTIGIRASALTFVVFGVVSDLFLVLKVLELVGFCFSVFC